MALEIVEKFLAGMDGKQIDEEVMDTPIPTAVVDHVAEVANCVLQLKCSLLVTTSPTPY
jgi:hypothetical protein